MDPGTMALSTTVMPRTMPSQSTSPSPRKEHFKKKNPEEGERYRKQYICKFCKTLI
jgi:hypothetical protein